MLNLRCAALIFVPNTTRTAPHWANLRYKYVPTKTLSRHFLDILDIATSISLATRCYLEVHKRHKKLQTITHPHRSITEVLHFSKSTTWGRLIFCVSHSHSASGSETSFPRCLEQGFWNQSSLSFNPDSAAWPAFLGEPMGFGYVIQTSWKPVIYGLHNSCPVADCLVTNKIKLLGGNSTESPGAQQAMTCPALALQVHHHSHPSRAVSELWIREDSTCWVVCPPKIRQSLPN